MLFALAAGTALSATVGSVSLLLGGVVHTGAVARVWRTWWLGDLCGALIVVPLAVAWHPPAIRRPSRGRVLETALLLVAVVGLSELAFRTNKPLTYVVFPALIWAALRFGQRGATLAIAITVAFAIWNTTHFVGPFAEHSAARTILEAQLYIAVTAVSTLFLAAVVAEGAHLSERLSASRARLVEAANVERRRLERNLHDGTQQRLTALIVRVGLARERISAPDVRAAFDDVESELTVALDELRDLAHGIHPSVLTQAGLGPAIRGIATRSAIPVELVELPSFRLGVSAEVTAYYVVAEAVANAHRHARASSVRIRASASHGRLRLEVADDGVGGASEQPGNGLNGLRDRVEAVGGDFVVDSPRGHGTRITATIPATAALNG